MASCSSTERSGEHILVNELLKVGKPAVIKNVIQSWNIPWTIEELNEQYGSTEMRFRVVHISQPDPVWESDGMGVHTTLKNFVKWVNGEVPANSNENPFCIFAPEDYWVYSSYNYMKELFSKDSSILKGVDWSRFGLPGRSGNESTIWIGSRESVTPFHMDTYGYNLVAQVIGQKKWILFPPEDSKVVYMTRIPYEESSIFGLVNVCNPDLSKHPLFKFSHPHVITLEPGDVLFVPPNWWHYVCSSNTTVSINTWIDIDTDDESRFHEAITKALMSIVIPACDINLEQINWLNPGESLIKPEDIEQFIKTTLNVCQKSIVNPDSVEDEVESSVDGSEEQRKVVKRDGSRDVHTAALLDNMVPVEELSFQEYHEKHCFHSSNFGMNVSSSCISDPVTLNSIANCFVHPDVITCIAEKLMDLRLTSLYFPD